MQEDSNIDNDLEWLDNQVIELDSILFEDLIADKNQTRVKDDQLWFIFFDSRRCKKCP